MNPRDVAFTDQELLSLFSGPIKYGRRLGYYLDANISSEIVGPLRARGIVLETVHEQGQSAEESDFRVLRRACELGLAMVTQDRDFRDIWKRLNRLKGIRHPGIILFKSRRVQSSVSLMAQLLAVMIDEPDAFENARIEF